VARGERRAHERQSRRSHHAGEAASGLIVIHHQLRHGKAILDVSDGIATTLPCVTPHPGEKQRGTLRANNPAPLRGSDGWRGAAWQTRPVRAPGYCPVPMLSRNMMLLGVLRSLPRSSSMASTGGTPTSARRSTETRWYSSG